MAQPNPNALYTKAFEASEALDKLVKVAKAWIPAGGFHLYIDTNIQGLNITVNGSVDKIAENPQVKNFKKQVEGKKSIRCTSAFLRHGNDANQTIDYKTSDGVIGEFTFKLQNSKDTIPNAIAALEKYFSVTDYIDLVRSTSPAIDDAAIQLRERSVADLQSQINKLADFLTQMAQREAEQREKLQEKLETDYQKRRDKLDEENRQRIADFEEFKSTESTKLDTLRKNQETRIAEQRKQLEDDRAAFNLKSEQGVRRDLLDKIQDVLEAAEVHNASSDTQNKRKIIHRIVFGVLLTGVSIAGLSIWKLYFNGTQTDWHYWVVYSASMLTLITTAVYYLKWNDRWFREHANAEFAAKRYKADILRASWLAELAGEWKKGDKELSPLLIDAFSKNLFSDVSSSDPSDHPMDEMTNLLKKATDVSFSKAGVSIKGIKSDK